MRHALFPCSATPGSSHRHPYPFEHLAFPNAGHVIVPGVDPGMTEFKHPMGVVIALGGTRAANHTAQEKAWTRVLEFLRADPMLDAKSSR